MTSDTGRDRPLGTARKPRRVVVHPHPDVRGRRVEIREFRGPIRMANGRWTYEPHGFAAFIDGVERPGRCRTKAEAIDGVGSWIKYLEWEEAR